MYEPRETGKRIKRLRKERGYTQERLCSEVGIGLKTYQAVEQGARGATIDMLCVLRSFYGVSLDYLVYGEADDDDLSFALQGLSAEEKKQILDVVNGIIRFGEMKNSHKNGE